MTVIKKTGFVVGTQLFYTFCTGIVVGFCIAYILQISASHITPFVFKGFLVNFPAEPADYPATEETADYISATEEPFNEAWYVDDHVAQELKSSVRLLCWIMTSPEGHKSKAQHVRATWGRRCNILLFMSSVNDTELPSIGLNVSEGRNNLWAKTKESFKYVYKHYFDQADWFMKADDDTYVIVENLRYLLSEYDPTKPLYFGCRFRPYAKQGYMSGGAGYVLSKEAVRRFAEDALPNTAKCRPDHGGAEDVEMGKCLELVNVAAQDTRDSLGRGRFFPFVPENHITPNKFPKDFWYNSWTYYPVVQGYNCCSDTAISFHYVPPNMMHVLDYFVYHLRPFGINERFTLGRRTNSPTTVLPTKTTGT